MRSRNWLFGPLMVVVLMLVGTVARGHAPIASRYTYNEHLFPVFRDRCGSCHVDGGIAPMSLLTYREAYPWAQSIREEVLALRMPPWRAEDGFGDFRNGHALPAHEMDMILEWSSGGYPAGPRDNAPPPVTSELTWKLGEPALRLQMADEFQVAEDVSDVVRFFVLPAESGGDRWIKAVDFQPGARAVVRNAAVYVDATGKARELDRADAMPGFAALADGSFPTSQPVAVWAPNQTPVTLDSAVAYRLPAGADVVVRIHYKKTWITEGQPFTDRSTVGLYFTDTRPAAVETMLITSPPSLTGRQATFTQTIERDLDVLALLPEVGVKMTDIRVEAIGPDGARRPLLLLREPDGAWPTRYWFESPVALRKGTTLEVTAVMKPGAERVTSTSLLAGAPQAPVRFLLDFVAGGRAPAN